MSVSLYDLYNTKISNYLYNISKIIYFIVIILIVKFITDDEFVLIYKLISYIYILFYIINLTIINIKRFDIYFISNRKKIYNVYIKLLIKEITYEFILLIPLIARFEVVDYFTFYLFNILSFTIIYFIYLSSAKGGALFSIIVTLFLIVNSVINYEFINIIVINITINQNIYISSDLGFNLLFFFIILVLCTFTYYRTTFRNIF